MSKYSEKIFQGELPTDEEWTDHLIEAHKLAPGMTPHAYAPYKTKEGLTSYEVLAQTLVSHPSNSTIVDLGCGDGHLVQFLVSKIGEAGKVIGIDMSEAELAIAKNKYSTQLVSFVKSKTQNLPLKDQSVDFALSHMAFMLMAPIEPVVSELARTLKRGGIFSAVIGNPEARRGLYSEIINVVLNFLDKRYPKVVHTRRGDRRAQTTQGLNELFTRTLGFEGIVERVEFALQITVTPQASWHILKDTYFIGMLPENDKEQLRENLQTFCGSKTDFSGKISFEFPMQKFTLKKSL